MSELENEIATLKVQNIVSPTVSPYLFLSVRHLISTLFVQANQMLSHVRFKKNSAGASAVSQTLADAAIGEGQPSDTFALLLDMCWEVDGGHVRPSAFTVAKENYCLFAHKNMAFEVVIHPQRHRDVVLLTSYTIKRV